MESAQKSLAARSISRLFFWRRGARPAPPASLPRPERSPSA
jgi:hypothetical protein